MGAVRTRRKAIFGAKMRANREGSPTKPQPGQVAEFLHVTATTVTRMEGGYTVPQWVFVLACLNLYGATQDQIDEVEALWQAARRALTKVENAADLTPSYVAFRRDEADAEEEYSWHYTAISGLFQSPGYAAAIFMANQPEEKSEAAREMAAKDRAARQQLLEGPSGLRVRAIMDEAVLRRVVGGPEVMRDALGHLLDVSDLPNVDIWIVPFTAGAWGTMNGPNIILRFGSEEDPDLAYLEHAGGGVTVENEPDVGRLLDIHKAVVERKAADLKKSRRLIMAARDAH